MTKTVCQLDDGTLCRYDAAFVMDSTASISKDFKYLGAGVIVDVGGYRYTGTERLRFFIKKRGDSRRLSG